jgi:hypothetical protein
MSKRSRVSHSGIGSQKARTSAPAADIDTQKIAGAQAMLDKLQEVEGEPEEVEDDSTPAGLRDLRELIFLGRTSKVVEIEKFKFEISTLSSNEKKELVINLGLKGARDLAAHIRTETMAIAIRSVNGVPLEDLYGIYGGADDSASDSERRSFVVGEMQSTLVEQLFKVYEELLEKSESVLKPEDKADLKK